MCTSGFLSAVTDCTSSGCGTRREGSTVVTRIIPDVRFTCNGSVVKWRAAGSIDSRRITNALLGIWRERGSESGTYDRVATIELGTCGNGVEASSVAGLTNVYECTLPENLIVSVKQGDIVGIEIARNNAYRFRLYFDDTNGGPTNYVFTEQLSTVATLSQTDSIDQDQPQISLTVDMATTTTAEVSTTTQVQPPATTTIATTTEATTSINVIPGDVTTATTVVMETTVTSTESPGTSTAQTTTTTSLEDTQTTTEDENLGVTGSTEEPQTMAIPITTRNAVPASTDDDSTTDVGTRDPSSNVGGASENIGIDIAIAGGSVGSIIGILLLVLIVLLVFLVLRQQRRIRKYATAKPDTSVLNPVYDGEPVTRGIFCFCQCLLYIHS